jgi:hypothetical protein
MISGNLSQQFLSAERARSPDTIIGILRKKLRGYIERGSAALQLVFSGILGAKIVKNINSSFK